ncbi:MAG: bacteriorhodopsin [Salinirussus sp.]
MSASSIGLWFGLGAAGMALGTLVLAAGTRWVPAADRRRYAILVAVPLIAVVAYVLMALGVGGIETTGGTVYLPRYVDWLLTTPLHVLYVGLLAGVSTSVLARTSGLQALTIVLGLGGALVDGPLAWLLFAAGMVAFGGVIYDAFVSFDESARGLPGDRYALFRQLRAFLVVLWLIYPVVWLLGGPGLGLLDTETASLVVAYLDVVSKVGLGLIAMNTWFGSSTAGAQPGPAD